MKVRVSLMARLEQGDQLGNGREREKQEKEVMGVEVDKEDRYRLISHGNCRLYNDFILEILDIF